jgi:hypothetical protein
MKKSDVVIFIVIERILDPIKRGCRKKRGSEEARKFFFTNALPLYRTPHYWDIAFERFVVN